MRVTTGYYTAKCFIGTPGQKTLELKGKIFGQAVMLEVGKVTGAVDALDCHIFIKAVKYANNPQ